MFKRRVVLATLIAAWVGTTAVVRTAAAQADKSGEAKGQTGAAGAAADANIKGAKAAANPKGGNAAIVAPEKKGGPKARAAVGVINFSNFTNLYIDIYVDGRFRGTIGPYGDDNLTEYSGGHVLYGRANFTDGTYTYWGPISIQLAGSYTWNLRP